MRDCPEGIQIRITDEIPDISYLSCAGVPAFFHKLIYFSDIFLYNIILNIFFLFVPAHRHSLIVCLLFGR